MTHRGTARGRKTGLADGALPLSGRRIPVSDDRPKPQWLPVKRIAKTTMGKRIREARMKRRWTQADLAVQAGLRYQAISKYEIGDSIPQLDALISLADALDTSIDWLVGRDE